MSDIKNKKFILFENYGAAQRNYLTSLPRKRLHINYEPGKCELTFNICSIIEEAIEQ